MMKGTVRTDSVDFWFSMGSTYTYLTVMRLPAVEKAATITFRWRPFYLRSILQEMKHVLYADKSAKTAYMWRDIERRSAMYGLPVRTPAPYPVQQSGLANRIAYVGIQEGWGPVFIQAAYRHWMQEGEIMGGEPNISASLRAADQVPSRVLDRAAAPEIDQALQEETNEAKRIGLFGSPIFVVAHELFWGDDRLEDAIQWHRTGSLAAASPRNWRPTWSLSLASLSRRR
jgi:2-hydroxychromene-2-carboxylate isomerase